MYRNFFVPFKMTAENLLGFLGEEYTKAKIISIRYNIPLQQVMDIKNIRYWQSNFYFEDGRIEHLHGQLIYADEHEVIIKIAFKFNANKGYEQLTTRATINNYQNATRELQHSNVTHEYYNPNAYNDTIIAKWLTRNLYINRSQLINVEFLAKTAKNRSQENDDELKRLIYQYQENLRIKEDRRKREIERKRQREAKRRIKYDLWHKRYIAWISRQKHKKQIRANEYQKRHAEREAKRRRLLLTELKQDLHQVKAEKTRTDYYQKRHEIRLKKTKKPSFIPIVD